MIHFSLLLQQDIQFASQESIGDWMSVFRLLKRLNQSVDGLQFFYMLMFHELFFHAETDNEFQYPYASSPYLT